MMLDITAYIFIPVFSSTATLRLRGLTQKVHLVVTVRYICCSLVADHVFNVLQIALTFEKS